MGTGTLFILGLITSLLGIGASNILAGKREQTAREENFRLNEEAANNADTRTRNLYNDLQNPSALLSQYQEAGLSPSLMFGGTPGGNPGQGAIGAGASGISPTTYGMEGIDANTVADIDLKHAEARKANAEADELEGLNPMGEAKLADIWADVGLKEASQKLTEAEEIFQNYENIVYDRTIESKVKNIEADANKAYEDAQKAFWEAERSGIQYQWDLQTFTDRAKIVSQQAANMIAEEAFIKSKTKLTDVERKKLAFDVQAELIRLKLQSKSVKAYGEQVSAYKSYLPDVINLKKWEVGTEVFNNIIRTAGYVTGSYMMDGETTTDETFETFDRKGKPQGSTRKQTHRMPKMRGFGGKW